MPTIPGTRASEVAAKFCSGDCRNNPNGCSYCGRTGPIVGVREAGTVKTLSGRQLAAYRELTFLQGRTERWTIYLTATHTPARSAQTLNSFQPDNSISIPA